MQLIKFILTVVSAAVTTVVFAYSTFETKDHISEMRKMRDVQHEEIMHQFDRMDDKLDRLLKK